jgi:hypothetical protein
MAHDMSGRKSFSLTLHVLLLHDVTHFKVKVRCSPEQLVGHPTYGESDGDRSEHTSDAPSAGQNHHRLTAANDLTRHRSEFSGKRRVLDPQLAPDERVREDDEYAGDGEQQNEQRDVVRSATPLVRPYLLRQQSYSS